MRKRVDSRRIALAWQEPWSGYGNVSAVVTGLRDLLPPTADGDEIPAMPAARGNPWKIPVLVAAYTVFMAIVGFLSVYPRFQLIDQGQAMVSLSFSHAGRRIRECRSLTQEELNKLPPNMRRPQDCPRERLPVRVVLSADGDTVYEIIKPAAGLWGDGAANIYRRLSLESGTTSLFIGMNESGEANGFDYSLEQVVDLEPGQHLVVGFDSSRQEFVFKQD